MRKLGWKGQLAINLSLAVAALYAAAVFVKNRSASLDDKQGTKSNTKQGPSGSRRPRQTAGQRCMGKNFYAILQLEKDATDTDIKKVRA